VLCAGKGVGQQAGYLQGAKAKDRWHCRQPASQGAHHSAVVRLEIALTADSSQTRLWIKDDDGDWECLDSPLLEAKGMDEVRRPRSRYLRKLNGPSHLLFHAAKMGFEDGHVVMLELMTGDEWPRDKYLSHSDKAKVTA
jgi:hypothetical protein